MGGGDSGPESRGPPAGGRRRRARGAAILLLALAAVAGAAWLLRERLGGDADGAERGEAPGEEVARGAEERIGAFLEADPPATLRLEGEELDGLLEHRVGPLLPRGVSRPAVSLGDSTAVVAADVRLDEVAGGVAPALRRLLGDSTRVVAEIRPSVPRPGVLRLRVLRLRAGDLPIPSMLVPSLIREMGSPAAEDPTALEYRVAADLTAVGVYDGGVRLERGGGTGTAR